MKNGSFSMDCPSCGEYCINIGSTKSKKNKNRKCPKCGTILRIVYTSNVQAPGHEEHEDFRYSAVKKENRAKRKK